MYNGIINIYKEKGYTSHDVVAKLRGILKQKKIGHTGTLDPDATGVLPVCLGGATKLCDMLADRSKTYKAGMLLGVITDTDDAFGKVIASNKPDVDMDRLTAAAAELVGGYEQVPPMYSARKVNGKKLYELAREGKTIERAAKFIEINSITIDSVDFPHVTMTIDCGKGTYIRSICRDIGEKLGCGACMESLVRTRVGGFNIEAAVTLEQAELLAQTGRLTDKITEIDRFFDEYQSIYVTDRAELLVNNGNMFLAQQVCENGLNRSAIVCEDEEIVRVYTTKGFAGLYCYHDSEQCFRPYKMFSCGE